MKPIEMINLVEGKHEFVDRWKQNCLKRQIEEDKWIESLRSKGVKAAHPDDGHVDRENNVIRMAYPDFNDGLEVGCLMALGGRNEFRIVKIVDKIEETSIFGPLFESWKFEEIKETTQ